MRQACGLYELRQRSATCVQAPRCHHTIIPQCVAPTHSKKKNPLREKTVTPYENENQNENLPEVLANSELWERVKDEGLVDENNMPTTSCPEAALLADMLAEKLGIGNKWKLFEKLWNRKNMRNDYNTALEQRKSLKCSMLSI